jgi:hypothetical protein
MTETWSVSPSVDMFLFGVTIPATVPQGSEIPEGLMNNPVYLNFSRLFPTIKGKNRVANNFIHNIPNLSNSPVLFLFLGKFSLF